MGKEISESVNKKINDANEIPLFHVLRTPNSEVPFYSG